MKPGRFLGYIRVSTEKQADEGLSLETQLDMIRGYTTAKGTELLEVYEDVASAWGKRSLARRLDLQAVIRRALELKVPILVARLDRLSRDASVLEQLGEPGLQIYSVEDGGRVSKRRLRDEIRRAARVAGDRSRIAQEADRKRRERGAGPRRGTITKAAQREGAISNMLRAEDKVRKLADFLERNRSWVSRPRKELLHHLNEIGLWNDVSLRENVRRPWTRDSLKKVLAKALEELALQDTIQTEDFAVFPGQDAVAPPPLNETAPNIAEQILERSADPVEGTPQSTDDDTYAGHPLLGIF